MLKESGTARKTKSESALGEADFATACAPEIPHKSQESYVRQTVNNLISGVPEHLQMLTCSLAS